MIEVLHDVGTGEEVVRGGVVLQEHRSVGLHLDLAGPVQLIDDLFRLGAGVDLHLDPASASLGHQLLELLRRIHQNMTCLKGAADANQLLLLGINPIAKEEGQEHND